MTAWCTSEDLVDDVMSDVRCLEKLINYPPRFCARGIARTQSIYTIILFIFTFLSLYYKS